MLEDDDDDELYVISGAAGVTEVKLKDDARRARVGKSTVDPRVTASTRGVNVSLNCRISARVDRSWPRNAGSFR